MTKYLILLTFMIFAAAADDIPKTTIAVMSLNGFNIAGDETKALTARFLNEIQNLNTYEVLEREQMNELLKEQGFQQSGACDETSCLVEIGKLLSVQKIVGGSISMVGATYTLQARLIDLQTSKIEKAISRDYTGGIDILMTKGMRELALELCGKLEHQNSVTLDLEPVRLYKLQSKSPVIAGLLGVVPGLGQLYSKNYIWAGIYAACFAVSFPLISNAPEDSSGTITGTAGTVGAFLMVFSWIGSIIHSPILAIQYNNKLKEKLGISWQLTPLPSKPALAIHWDF